MPASSSLTLLLALSSALSSVDTQWKLIPAPLFYMIAMSNAPAPLSVRRPLARSAASSSGVRSAEQSSEGVRRAPRSRNTVSLALGGGAVSLFAPTGLREPVIRCQYFAFYLVCVLNSNASGLHASQLVSDHDDRLCLLLSASAGAAKQPD